MADYVIHKPAAPEPASSIWLVTFTDLVALLLTFFVMLFSMSNVKVDKWTEMIDAITKTLNPARTTAATVPQAQYNISSVFRPRAINVDYLTAVLEQKIRAESELADIRLTLLDDRLVVSLPGNLTFEPGGAVLAPPGRRALFTLGGVLRHVDNQLGAIGYSVANIPEEGDFSSNWELSLARATEVSNALHRAGYPRDILVLGHGDSRASYLAGLPPDLRQALSERVDIVVLSASRAN